MQAAEYGTRNARDNARLRKCNVYIARAAVHTRERQRGEFREGNIQL